MTNIVRDSDEVELSSPPAFSYGEKVKAKRTIRNADRIYVMEQGRITQVGSYPELLGAPGLFRQLAARQVA